MMRQLLIKSLVGSSLLLFCLSAQAQAPRYQYYDRIDFQNGQTLFHQVRADIDRAQRDIYSDFDGGAQYRFERVRGELSELQRQWDENDYSPRQVDNVIGALQRVLTDNRLLLRDRDMLASDLSQLRDFRATHEY
jgi:hypothetical protein